MKAREFYSQAMHDPGFRKQRLEEARFHGKMAIGFAVGIIVVWLGYIGYCGIADRRFPGDVGVSFALVLCASLYAQARAKLGALEAMHGERSNRAAQPTPDTGRG